MQHQAQFKLEGNSINTRNLLSMKRTFNSKIMFVLYLRYQGASYHCAKSGKEEFESISACPATAIRLSTYLLVKYHPVASVSKVDSLGSARRKVAGSLRRNVVWHHNEAIQVRFLQHMLSPIHH